VDFVYQMRRTAAGSETGYHDIKAGEIAVRRAEDRLEQMLTTDFDTVPCPKCGHFQSFMIQRIRERHCPRGLYHAGILLLILCAPFALAYPVVTSGHQVQAAEMDVLGAVSIVGTLGCLLSAGLIWRYYRRLKQFDLNQELGVEERIEIGRTKALGRDDYCSCLLSELQLILPRDSEEAPEDEFTRSVELLQRGNVLETLSVWQYILSIFPTRGLQ
jgi:hypothetical protein